VGRRAAAHTGIHHHRYSGVVAAGERWKVLWEEPGNNADGIVTVDDEGVLVARNDKSDVLRVDRAGKTLSSTPTHHRRSTCGQFEGNSSSPSDR
jgi:hypothetical protein